MDPQAFIRSEVRYDLAMHKEFRKITAETYTHTIISSVIVVCSLCYLISMFYLRFSVIMFLVLSAFYLVRFGIVSHKNRDGGVEYKQILHRNDGIPHEIITLAEDGIRTLSQLNGSEKIDQYDNIRYILESKNLLILVTDIQICHILDKNTLSGGTRDDAVRYLREKCPGVKKQVRTGLLGRIVHRLMWGVIAVGIVWGIAVLLYIPQTIAALMTVSGTSTSYFVEVSYRELAQELETAGIIISEDVLDIVGSGTAYCPSDTPKSDNYRDLLCWEGQGNYEKNVFYQEGSVEAYDWNWTPSTSGVYWFDTEVSNFGSIYTDFLHGIAAMDEALIFTNVNEDYSQASIPAGQGTITFSFDYNEEAYTFEAEYNNDWFDTDMLFAVGRILAADGDPNDLWFTVDRGQGLLLYYGTAEEVSVLEQITGIDFLDTETMWIGH